MQTSFKWLSLAAALLFSFSVKPQKIFFEQLTTAEGLPSDYVNCVFRDNKGYLWIGTDKGACRYDGKQFLYLNKDNGLTSNFVYCIAEDPDGNIWLGTFEGGICKYDGRNIIPHNINKNEFANIRRIHFNADKSFFIVNDHNLYYSRSEKAVPEKVKDCKESFSPVNDDLFITGNGKLIYLLKKNSHDLSVIESPRQDFYSISNGQLLVKEKNTISCFNTDGKEFKEQRKFVFTKNKLPDNDADIKQWFVNDDELFVATVNGIIYTNEKKTELFLNSSNGLGADYIRGIYKDKSGTIYFYTFGGGIRIWPHLYLQEFGASGKITSILPAGDCTYLTSSKNVYKHTPGSNQFFSFSNSASGNFTTINKSASGRFYLGTLNNFFVFPDETVLNTLTEKNIKKYSITANSGTSGFLPSGDKLYVSTYGEGINLFDNNNKHTGYFNKVSSGIVEFLVPLKKSFAALTYSAGASLHYDDGTFKQITTEEKLLSNTVYSVFQETDNELWIGTLKGLNLFKGNTVIKTFSANDGLIGSKVICIFRDAQKKFWVLSDKYLHILENDRLRAIRSHPVLYDPKNSINRAAYDKQNDLLYIGLTDALLTVDIKKIIPDTSIQQPEISRIAIDTTLVDQKEKTVITLPASGKLTIGFGNHFAPLARKSDLYYKLAGFDDEWRRLDNSSEAIYQKLPAGKYEFIAKTINPDGYASAEITLLQFEVLPPLWKRAWFVALVSLFLLAGFFFTGHIISKKRYKQKIRRLQEEYRLQLERERIAMELHDNVGSQLTYLINKIDDDYPMLADKKEADQLGNFARGAMQELRETIWALDKKEVLLFDLDNKIMQLTSLYNRERNIIRYDWNGNSTNGTSVKSLQALNIYRIIQETLNNAVKYSEAEKIYVIVEMKGRAINIKITDDGKGFNIQNIVPGYGLRNMKNRAKEMNATLDIRSETGKGTVLLLTVPLN